MKMHLSAVESLRQVAKSLKRDKGHNNVFGTPTMHFLKFPCFSAQSFIFFHFTAHFSVFSPLPAIVQSFSHD
jgi:hypothetical protein